MIPLLEELDYQDTPIGKIVLRRRRSNASPDGVTYEVTINDDMLMSSTVNVSEKALSWLALDTLGDQPCDVLVGGLGLGYTAAAALEYPNVRSLVVVELLAPVISWHARRLVPLADTLIDDPRYSVIQDDFFQYVQRDGDAQQGDPAHATPRYHAILLDIDHSPESWLHKSHGRFYTPAALQGLAQRLHPGGVFALWSADKPADAFLGQLAAVFPSIQSHNVPFHNPHVNEMDSNYVILATGL